MTYFLGLTVLPLGRCSAPSPAHVASAFPAWMSLKDISATPFGEAVGGGSKRLAFLLTTDGCSTDLMGKGPARASRVNEFKSCLKVVFETYGGFALVVRFFRGDVGTETVSIRRTAKISLESLLETFPELEEDTRYVCTWRG